MKCVCGYEGEDFIKLESRERVEANIVYIFALVVDGKRKQVYACPKCGTLKIEIKE